MTSSESIDPTRAEHRIDIDADSAGFDRPPCPVYVKFFQEHDGWQVVALTPPGRATEVGRWLERHDPRQVEKGEGLAPKVVRASFAELPQPWDELVQMANVRFVELRPQGAVSIFLDDHPDRVRALQEHIGLEEVRLRRSLGGRTDAHLTPRQLEVLSLAVALGYYELPHRVHQRTIAQRLGMSVGSTSEILRRGEAQIIKSYVDGLVGSKWDDQEQNVLDLVRQRADAKELRNEALDRAHDPALEPRPAVARRRTRDRMPAAQHDDTSSSGIVDPARVGESPEDEARLRQARRRRYESDRLG